MGGGMRGVGVELGMGEATLEVEERLGYNEGWRKN